MRVLHVSESFASGTLEVIRALSAGLAARGHEVIVAHGARPETPRDVADLFDPRVELVALPWSRRTARGQLAAARALRRLAAERRPELVHLHSSFAGAVGAVALGRSSCRLVYTPHGSALLRTDSRLKLAAYRLAERFVARRMSVIGAVSESEARVARRLGGGTAIAVVPNGVPELDAHTPPPTRGESERVIVAGIGRLGAARPAAPAARILSALGDLATPVWIGDAIDARDAELLRGQGVEVTGWLPHDAAMERLAEATACLHWSAWDGQAMVILEALARDVVVVASDVAANRELLGDAQVRGDEADATALLRSVVTERGTRDALLDAQRERRRAFGADRMTDGWLRVYAAG